MQVEIKNTKSKGRGLYSLIHFDANQVILSFGGKLLDRPEVMDMPREQSALLLQIGTDKFLDIGGEVGFFSNHSCNGNCYVKILANTAFLVSTRPIAPGDEICFDYSITSTDTLDIWKMDCSCKQWNCRGTISGFQLLNEKDKQKFIKMGIVPRYNINI